MMTPILRKISLTVHVTSSVGWLGAVAAFLALAVVGLKGDDAQMVRSAYLAMDMTAKFVIVPLAFASLLTGLVQSLGTSWGLLRHYWVLAKLLLTAIATVVLLLKVGPISQLAGVAAATMLSSTELIGLRISLTVHAAGGLLVLLAIVTLAIFKPAGLTRYGAQKFDQLTRLAKGGLDDQTAEVPTTRPRWVTLFGLILIVLVAVLGLMMAVGGHGPGMHAAHGDATPARPGQASTTENVMLAGANDMRLGARDVGSAIMTWETRTRPCETCQRLIHERSAK